MAVLVTLLVAGMPIVSRLFGDAEFILVRNKLTMFLGGFLRPVHGGYYQTRGPPAGQRNWALWWAKIIASASDLNLDMVRLNVNMPAIHEGYHARWDCAHGQKEDGNYWRTEIPLLAQGHIMAGWKSSAARSRTGLEKDRLRPGAGGRL